MPTATETSVSDRVLAVISNARSPISPRDLREKTGMDGDDLAVATARLASGRKITWADNGGWKMVENDSHG